MDTNQFKFLIYHAAEGDVSVNAIIKDETIWLTQKAMAELFGVNVPAISKHLANIYEEGELSRDSTVSKMEIVQNEGTQNPINIYADEVCFLKSQDAFETASASKYMM